MVTITKKVREVFGSIALVGYLSLFIFVPIHLIHMTEMDMSDTSSSHCPFEVVEKALCATSISEHARTWQSWLGTFSPSMKLSFPLFFIAQTFTLLCIDLHLRKIQIYTKRRRWLSQNHFFRSLFSEGILHSKAH